VQREEAKQPHQPAKADKSGEPAHDSNVTPRPYPVMLHLVHEQPPCPLLGRTVHCTITDNRQDHAVRG
jgi:hypothetical protein